MESSRVPMSLIFSKVQTPRDCHRKAKQEGTKMESVVEIESRLRLVGQG